MEYVPVDDQVSYLFVRVTFSILVTAPLGFLFWKLGKSYTTYNRLWAWLILVVWAVLIVVVWRYAPDR